MRTLEYLVLLVGWLGWATPFLLAKRSKQPAQTIDRRARWGIALAAVGYSLVWQGRFWERPLPVWHLALSIQFLALADVLAWTATRALGRQWRIDAGLSTDHELVTHGPYSIVRNPIYTSMFCVLLGTGIVLTPPLRLAIAVALLVAGTEIRVHIEERLLASRFGEEFEQYRRKVPAYIPFLR